MVNIREGLSYGDVLLVPKLGVVKSRRDVSLRTRITKNIFINTPLVSANMDTVTESDMAIAMASLGGIGIIHQFMTVDAQAEEVRLVKKSTSHIVEDPLSIHANLTLGELHEMFPKKYGFLVVDENNKLIGILSKRDYLYVDDDGKKVKDLMTKEVITAPHDISVDDAKKILQEHRIEKLPLVDANNKITGLITAKDIEIREKYPNANRDKKGRLLVAAAVGVKDGFLDRAKALVQAGADLLCVDMAHGHSTLAINTVKELKKNFPNVDVLAGNIATAEGAQALIDAGADGLKVGVGPGSACTTRIVAGTGVPQITAILDVCSVAKKYDIPVMADGGIKTGGDIAKAIVAGAETMLGGNIFSATSESPGRLILKDGKRFKLYRGSASTAANIARTKREKAKLNANYTAEGVDTLKPYKGPVEGIFNELIGGLSSGLSYCGAKTIKDAQENGEFIKISMAGMIESLPQFGFDGSGHL